MLSTLAFVINAFVGIFSYKYIFENVDSDIFVAWFTVFEISQIFLLTDFGFTHSFIKSYGNSSISKIEEKIPNLRSVLYLSGAVSFLCVYILSIYLSKRSDLYLEFLFLSFSIFITLVSYTETTELRLKNKFKHVYFINIISSVLFILTLFLSKCEPISRLAIAIMVRSLSQFILQTILIRRRVKFGVINFENWDGSIIFINATYFLLIMTDLAIFSFFSISSLVLAQLAVNKKLYEVGRGIVDSALQVFSVKYSRRYEVKTGGAENLIIIILFFIIFFSGEFLLNVWLDGYDYSWLMSITLCISAILVSLFRRESLSSYYNGSSKSKIIVLAMTAIFAKIGFVISIYFDLISLPYLAQALMLLIGLVFVKWKKYD